MGHSAAVESIDFSPDDNKILASGSDDRTVILWNKKEDDPSSNDLLKHGCEWARDYLKNNSNIDKSDRSLCDGVKSPDHQN